MQQVKIILLGCIIILTFFTHSLASRKTIDADGPADYPSLDSLMGDIYRGTIDPDTVLFIGTNQHTYNWTRSPNRNIGTIFFTSIPQNPDSFPIIYNTENNKYSFFNNNNVTFEKVILTGDVEYYLAQGNKLMNFKRCVIKDMKSSNALRLEGGNGSGWFFFENCLFVGLNNIFKVNLWNPQPTISIMCCTFDNNNRIWYTDQLQTDATVYIKNCIFTNNITTFDRDNIRKRALYCVTSEDTTGYHPSCVKASDPLYVKSSRTNPSDWQIVSSSSAANKGDTDGASTIDLG
ncbi:MAG: hypothetical protein N2053_11525, partial [Chitinispirillaceae bacterium]|nr:hypothetical protein [Chitinispirillaceae bacterium]